MGSATWATRLHHAAETVMWMAKLNAWWWLFTALGLGLLGAGPATAAGAVLVRRRGDGELPRLRDFARIYRAEFVRANFAIGPGLALALFLANNLRWVLGWAPAWLIVATGLALIATTAACCLLGALYAFYDLRATRYFAQAVRIAVCRPHWSALMILITAAIVFACSYVPALAIFVAVGVWLHTCTWLGLRFCAENEARLDAAQATGRPEAVMVLPSEPLRMH